MTKYLADYMEPRVPRYERLKQALFEEISSGRLRPGAMVPPERVLREVHRVSTGTVRRALAELVNAGILRREQGRGTFVTKLDLAGDDFHRFFRYTKGLSPLTVRPSARILGFTERRAPREVVAALGLPVGARVYQLRRLRLVGTEPLMLQTSFLPVALFPGLRARDLDGRLLYEVLGERYGQVMARVDEYIAPGVASAREAALLGLRPGTPVLRIDRIAYTLKEQPIEYRRNVGRGGDYRYYVQLR